MKKYDELWKLVCELERPMEPITESTDPLWLRLTELVDAMFPPELQRIADAYSAGKIREQEHRGPYYFLNTSKGSFVVVETGRHHGEQITLSDIKAEIAKSHKHAESCLTVKGNTPGFHKSHRTFLMFRVNNK